MFSERLVQRTYALHQVVNSKTPGKNHLWLRTLPLIRHLSSNYLGLGPHRFTETAIIVKFTADVHVGKTSGSQFSSYLTSSNIWPGWLLKPLVSARPRYFPSTFQVLSTKFIPLASTFPLNSRLTSLTCQLDTSIWCPIASQMNMSPTEVFISHSFHPVNCISVNSMVTAFCSSQNLRGLPLFLYSFPSI